jgi:hypothetical protein
MAVFIVANGVRTVCRHGWMVRHRVLRSVGGAREDAARFCLEVTENISIKRAIWGECRLSIA